MLSAWLPCGGKASWHAKFCRGRQKDISIILFRETENPIHVLDFYLKTVHDESIRRGYNFDLSKISPCESRPHSLLLPDKQLEYEFLHLLDKLKERSPRQYSLLRQTAVPLPHPLFQITPGDICSWEKKPVSSLT